MYLINILSDSGYLIQNSPPFLNFELPNAFGSRRTWLKGNPTKGIEFCKREYGSDAAVAATLHCVGAEVVDFTSGDKDTGFSILSSHIDSFLEDIKTPVIDAEVERVQAHFDSGSEDDSMLAHLDSQDSAAMELKRIEKAHNTDEDPYYYCDSCGETLAQSFPYRCGNCDARFPGWPAVIYSVRAEFTDGAH